jgi:YVTN family beta-propeller protein
MRAFRFFQAVGFCALVTSMSAGTAAAGDATAPMSGVSDAPDAQLHELQTYVGPVEHVLPVQPVDALGSRALTSTFLATAVPPEGDGPSELAFTPDGSKIVVAHRDSTNLVVFDAATRSVLQTIPLSGSPNSLAIAADGVTVVTANLFENTASIVDLGSGTETGVVPVGTQPGVARITPDGLIAIVENTVDSDLSVIDIATATELRRIPVAGIYQLTSWGSWAVVYKFTDFEITPDSATVLFPDRENAQVRFCDIATGFVTSVATAASPCVVDLSPDGTVAVVSHDYPDSRVTILDVPGQAVTASYPTGGSATFIPPIAINPSKTKAVVVVQNAVRVMTLSSGATSSSISTGTPNALGTTADGLYCVVGNYLGSIISYASESIVANTLNTTTPDALAVSPADARAATAHALRKEMMEVMNVSGSAGHLEGVVPTGPPPEGDKARNVAVSVDGTRAIVINNHSQNATVFDLGGGTIEATVDVGERPGGVAITPDGTKAVVANLDSSHASVIDLGTFGVTNIPISTRGSAVAISPTGVHAYIPVVASGDGVWRINVNTLSVDGAKLLTGNMGGIGYVFDLASGMTLSPDGATLVTCGTYDDNLSIIDTAAWVERKRVAVGDFPVRAVFSPDGSLIYVTNKYSNTVSVVSNAGAASALVDTIAVGDQPFQMAVKPAGTKLYVGNFADKTISVIDLPANLVTNTIPLPPTGGAGEPVGLHVSADGGSLYVAANGADFHVIDTATETIVDTLNIGLAPAELVFHDASRRAFIPSPYGDDGLTIIAVAPPVCRGDTNCDGQVDFGDINSFVDAIVYDIYCDETGENADIDENGSVGFEDINPFVELVTTNPLPIPCP